MGWEGWYECKFEGDGELDRSNLSYYAPRERGIYAIATKTGWSYNVQYIGRSGSDIRGRLQAHFSGKPPRIKAGRAKYKGNELIGDVIRMKRDNPERSPDALYFAFLKIPEKDMDVIFESVYIDCGEDERPIGNFIRGKRLPDGLREEDVIDSPLEEDDSGWW
jgi:hypothetical protein